MADIINVKGIERAAVLMALHDAAVPRALHGGYPVSPLSRTEADAILEETETFAYVNGRALFFTFEGDLVHVREYDARNGQGTAERTLAPMIAAYERGRAANDDVRELADAVGAMAGLP